MIICCSQLNTQGVLGWFPVSGFLVIDAVRLWSMYFVIMPRVNLVVILMTYLHYLCSINCPTVICLPSMILFILWRDTASELWTPVQFPLHCFTILLLLTLFTFLHTIVLLPLDTLNPLFTASRWDWEPHRKLGAKFLVVLCAGFTLLLGEEAPTSTMHQQVFYRHCPECREASKHHFLKFGFLLLVR
jgi:hypothetical protein